MAKPPPGFFKVNWDDKGLVRAAQCKTIDAYFDPTTAEDVAALYAAELCRDLGVLDIFLEGDSMTMVKAIETNPSWSRNGQIVEDIKLVCRP